MVKDSESYFRCWKKSLSSSSNAGGRFGFKGQWEKGKQVRKREIGFNWLEMAFVAHIVAIQWLWRHKWLAMTGGLAIRWRAVLVQGYWAAAVPCCKRSEPVLLPMSPSTGRFLSQPCSCKIQTLPKGGLHGAGQSHLSSVSAALCSAPR